MFHLIEQSTRIIISTLIVIKKAHTVFVIYRLDFQIDNPIEDSSNETSLIDEKAEISTKILQIRPNIIQRIDKTMTDNDDNNNNHQRSIATDANDLKCHECGKIFVTRTSLKVRGQPR